MGHYASEMEGPEDAEKGKDAFKKQVIEQIAHITFLWTDLYPRYEQRGSYISSNDMLTCPRCFVEVKALLREKHNDWHRSEYAKSIMGPGLFG